MRQILSIDCGNSNIKWALFAAPDGQSAPQILRGGAFATQAIAEHLSVLVASVQNVAAANAEPLRIMVANVAGESVAAALRCAFSAHPVSLQFVESTPQACGLMNGYTPPQALGVDRFAALVAAQVSASSSPQNQLVVLAGTALTIDALSSNGVFLGGLIVPGVNTMQTALHQRTAQLPLVHGQIVITTFPTNTAAAIANGALRACVGAVLLQALAFNVEAQKTGGKLHRVVIAGGAAQVLVDALNAALSRQNTQSHNLPEVFVELRPQLVLEGLYYLAVL